MKLSLFPCVWYFGLGSLCGLCGPFYQLVHPLVWGAGALRRRRRGGGQSDSFTLAGVRGPWARPGVETRPRTTQRQSSWDGSEGSSRAPVPIRSLHRRRRGGDQCRSFTLAASAPTEGARDTANHTLLIEIMWSTSVARSLWSGLGVPRLKTTPGEPSFMGRVGSEIACSRRRGGGRQRDTRTLAGFRGARF